MHYTVLVVDHDKEAREELVEALVMRGLKVVSCDNFDDACDYILSDGTIHAVLSEWNLPRTSQSEKWVKGLEIFKKFLGLRFELSLFLYTCVSDTKDLTSGGIINGYFLKDEKVYDDIVRKIQAEIGEKNHAPFYEKLVRYALKAKDSWHTPGHASGNSVKYSPYAKDFMNSLGKICSFLMYQFPFLSWTHCCTRKESLKNLRNWHRGHLIPVIRFSQQTEPPHRTRYLYRACLNPGMLSCWTETAINQSIMELLLPEPNLFT